jgi:hypothetical protein
MTFILLLAGCFFGQSVGDGYQIPSGHFLPEELFAPDSEARLPIILQVFQPGLRLGYFRRGAIVGGHS